MHFNRAIILFAATVLLKPALLAETGAEQLLQATFKVFNTDSTSTGFLLRDPSPNAARTNVVLVTTGHTFARAKGDHIDLVCRTQDAAGAWHRLDHKILIRTQNQTPLWVSHSTQDVAALRCALPPQAVFEALPPEALAEASDLERLHVTIGTPLFFLGYPYRTEANDAAFPLLREAVASGYPLTPVRAYPTFNLSAHTFAGDSGAPVALRTGDSSRLLVIGMVIARTQQNDRLNSQELELNFKRDMGLGTMIHATFIRETLSLLK